MILLEFAAALALLSGVSTAYQFLPLDEERPHVILLDTSKFVKGNTLFESSPYDPEGLISGRRTNIKRRPSSCRPLPSKPGVSWGGPVCSTFNGAYMEGAFCLATCSFNQLMGPRYLTCNSDGSWRSHVPMNETAECWSVEQISESLYNKIRNAVTQAGSLKFFFILQESRFLPEVKFIAAKRFLSNIVFSFPLSPQRRATLLTFARWPRLHQLDEIRTCSFLNGLSLLSAEGTGASYQQALTAADKLLADSRSPAVIFFVVYGNHDDVGPWVPVAEKLKIAGHQIIVIAVGDVDVHNLQKVASTGLEDVVSFYQFRDFEHLEELSRYMRTNLKMMNPKECKY